jgi:NADH-quinone oxidoreductase subunit J
MNAAFYLSAAVAAIATLMTITRANAMHALLYLIVSLFAIAVIFYVLGAPFAAVLEVIVYAGAIMVLFVFVIMMLISGTAATERERAWLAPRVWIGPSILSAVLLGELGWVLSATAAASTREAVGAKAVALRLFGPDLLAVEIASMLLLAGLVGAFRLSRGIETRAPDEARARAAAAEPAIAPTPERTAAAAPAAAEAALRQRAPGPDGVERGAAPA